MTWAPWSTYTPGATIDRSTWAPEMIEPSQSNEPSTWAGSPPGPRDTFAGGSVPRYVYTGHRALYRLNTGCGAIRSMFAA